MGKGVAFNHYHTVIVRTKLTQKIQNLVPILLPEIEERFDTLIGDPSGKTAIQRSCTIFIVSFH